MPLARGTGHESGPALSIIEHCAVGARLAYPLDPHYDEATSELCATVSVTRMIPPERHGPWQIMARHEIYRDPWIEVDRHDVIRPDGQDGTHCVVRLKPGVSVLPVDDKGWVYLTEEFHYGVGRTTIEAVSGGIEPPEDALATARRELAEELGITAGEWIDLGVCDPFTSVVVSPTRLFLARQLTFGRTAPEGTEQIGCRAMSLEEAVRMVLDSRITHAPSGVLILKAQHVLGQR